MTKHKKSGEEEYEGASPATVALGHGSAYGWMGTVIGGIGGAIVSAISTREVGNYTKRATDFLAKVGVHVSGRSAIIAGGSFFGLVAGRYVGMAIGFKRGLKDANRGRDQFERIKAERDQALGELDTIKEEAPAASEPGVSYTEGLAARAEQGGHAAAVLEKSANETQVAR